MKKLLGLLGAVGLVATTSATVVSCGKKDTNNSSIKFKDEKNLGISGNKMTKTLSKTDSENKFVLELEESLKNDFAKFTAATKSTKIDIIKVDRDETKKGFTLTLIAKGSDSIVFKKDDKIVRTIDVEVKESGNPNPNPQPNVTPEINLKDNKEKVSFTMEANAKDDKTDYIYIDNYDNLGNVTVNIKKGSNADANILVTMDPVKKAVKFVCKKDFAATNKVTIVYTITAKVTGDNTGKTKDVTVEATKNKQ